MWDILGWGVKTIGVPLFTTWATGEIMGNSKPQPSSSSAPTRTATPVRDSAPGTINTKDGNTSATSSQNTLIIGAVALVAVVMLVKKK